MGYSIIEIEGIGEATAEKLAAAGIKKTDHLLSHCGSASGRKTVAEATGLSTAALLKWANMADLMRVSGIGSQFSELLEAAGVDTVKELQHRRADNLVGKMTEVNAEKKLTRRVPTAAEVERWIEHAKTLPPVISH